MPVWGTILISILGAVSTILGILGITSYIGERMRHKAQRKNKAEDKSEEEISVLKHQKYMDELRAIIREENAPIIQETAEIKHNLSLNTKGTVTILRNDMKKALDFCKEKGYATASDRANWTELYNTYAELGGNHFREYVDAWKQELDDLPLKKKTRKILNETKIK